MEFIERIPISTLSLILISSSLVITVLVGGTVYVLRNRRRRAIPSPEFESTDEEEEKKLPPPDTDILSWEAELASKIERLEEAFNLLRRRLNWLEESTDSRTNFKIISRKEANGKELLPLVAELKSRGLDPGAIAKKLKLSDEQVALLLNSSMKGHMKKTVGA